MKILHHILFTLTLTATLSAQASNNVDWVHDLSIRHLGFGDLNAWYPQLYIDADSPLLDGETTELVIKGDWAKARYFSLTIYDYKWRAIANLNDQEIIPKSNSINPALPGADWNAENRKYEIRVRFQEEPEGGAEDNTFYVANGADGLPTDLLRIAYRVYLPSDGEGLDEELYIPRAFLRDIDSGVKIPPPDIFFDNPEEAGFDLADTDPPPPVDAVANCDFAPIYLNALQWRRSFEIPITSENPDTVYIFAPYIRCKGYNLVVRFKVPDVPNTYDNEGIVGDEQMRYWSMSLGGQFTNGKLTLTDQGPLSAVIDENGYVNLVLGWKRQPVRATAENGYTFIDLKEINQREGVLILRNILPADDFEYSALPVEPGEFVEDELGEYLPVGTYVRGRDL